jgi:hypothetical protein
LDAHATVKVTEITDLLSHCLSAQVLAIRLNWGQAPCADCVAKAKSGEPMIDRPNCNPILFLRIRAAKVAWPVAFLVLFAMGASAGLKAQSQSQNQAGDQSQTKSSQQSKTPLTLKPDLPGTGTNHRLILKDGSYQVVRRYEIVDDRVRYISAERGGEWEELPANLVDWEATRKWERDHANQGQDENGEPAAESSPAMKEAAEIDKEETNERNEQRFRRPEVATGLELPDQDGVFVLDTYHGTPELVELQPNDLNVKSKIWRGLSTLSPLAGAKADLELEGAHAKIHLHVNDPAIYLSLESRDDAELVISHALTVQTGGAGEAANRKHGAHSEKSGFAIVHVDERKAVRIVGAIHVSVTGTVTQDEDTIPAKVEVLPGKHWLKITPQSPLRIGEYALVEILSASEMNQSVWDFRVDPQLGDNQGAIGPILK